MSYHIVFIFMNNLIKSNEIDVNLHKRYNILLKKVILLFSIVLSIKAFINIDQIIHYLFIELI